MLLTPLKWRRYWKGNVIQLEDEVTLPDGMRVTVTPEQPTASRGLKPSITLQEWLHEARQVRAQLPSSLSERKCYGALQGFETRP
jgi:hypothetical protein